VKTDAEAEAAAVDLEAGAVEVAAGVEVRVTPY